VGDNASSRQLLESTFLPKHPKDIPELRIPVSIVVESIEALNKHAAEIRLRSDHLALFVVLTTRAQGRFSENAFALRPMETKVRFGTGLFDHCCETLSAPHSLSLAISEHPVCSNDGARGGRCRSTSKYTARGAFGVLSSLFQFHCVKRRHQHTLVGLFWLGLASRIPNKGRRIEVTNLRKSGPTFMENGQNAIQTSVLQWFNHGRNRSESIQYLLGR
jgi:hypothetical protein